jgi:YVTN family beta-propeller protein
VALLSVPAVMAAAGPVPAVPGPAQANPRVAGARPVLRPAAPAERAGPAAPSDPRPSGVYGTEVGSVAVGTSPADVAVDLWNGQLYVTDYGQGAVSVLNGSTDQPVEKVAVGSRPMGIAFDGVNGCLYVADEGANAVSVIEGSSDLVIATLSVGSQPYDVAFDPLNELVYVTNSGSGNVSVINPAAQKVVRSIPVGLEPDGIAVDPASAFLYVANYGSQNVSVINATRNRAFWAVPAGAGPSAVAYDRENGFVYVTNGLGTTVSVINGLTYHQAGSLTVGTHPDGVAVDLDNSIVYIANAKSANVTLINGTIETVVGVISAGADPDGGAFDPQNGRVFVANGGSANVTIIAPKLSVGIAADPAEADPGVPVTFTAVVLGGLPPFPYYAWEFGDVTGANGTTNATNHTYAAAGRFDVSIVLEDAVGVNATGTAVYQVNRFPVAGAPSAENATTLQPVGGADAGARVVFQAAADLGTAPYGPYRWSGLPPGCANATGPNVSCVVDAPGELEVAVAVSDDLGAWSAPGPTLSFPVYADPVAAEPGANRSSTDLGLVVELWENASGGPGGFSSYAWSGLGGALCEGWGSANLTCQFERTGTYSVAVSVTDPFGVASAPSPTISIQVLPLPKVASPTESRASADVNQTVNFTTNASGGAGGYRFAWQGLPPGCAGATGPAVSCPMGLPGPFSVSVAAIDANGGRSTESPAVAVDVSPVPWVVAPQFAPAQPTVGELVTVSVASAGGSGGEIFRWSGLPPGCAGSTAAFNCTPAAAGTFVVSVRVVDSNGGVGFSPVATLVVGPPAPAAPTVLGLPPAVAYGLVGALILAAVAVGAIALAWRRLGRARAPAEPPEGRGRSGPWSPPLDERTSAS